MPENGLCLWQEEVKEEEEEEEEEEEDGKTAEEKGGEDIKDDIEVRLFSGEESQPEGGNEKDTCIC
jgi:hypothetical protein